MELRSNRSRSKTPFTRHSLERDVIENENHVEQTVRTTRSTTKIYEKVTDDVTVNSIQPTKYKASKTEKSVRKKLKTSDYSSEEGENVVSSSRTMSQNEKNHLIEDARAANGSTEVSALELYRKAGRYWDVYPKTDWTYSQHSKDRIEIAPGVVAMPNMSRRSLHNNNTSTNEFSTTNKYTNTESYDTTDSYTAYSSISSLNYQPRALFTSNNYARNYESTNTSRFYNRVTISRMFVSIYITIVAMFYYFYKKQNSVVIWLLKKVHYVSSSVAVYDTWLLKSKPRWVKDNKIPMLLMLGMFCLLPLFLLGGWWLLSSLSHAIYGIYLNRTSTPLMPLVIEESEKISEYKQPVQQPQVGLTRAQLDEIVATVNINKNLDYEFIIQKILNSADIKTIINNNARGDSEQIINGLKEEISKIKLEMAAMEKERNSQINNLISQLRSESMQNNAHLMYELKRCCRRSYINIEGHVTRILRNLLSQSADENDIMRLLHTLFVAKQDLEVRLANLTQNMHKDFDAVIENNGRRIMEEISTKIETHFKHTGNLNIDSLSNNLIEEIVQNALAVYDADKTGLVDYAMEPLGGQVLSTRCTESYSSGTAVISILGIPLWHPTNSPRTVITPEIKPGECWAFQNFPGFLIIKLVSPINIEAFSIEHVSKSLVPGGRIDSAPKDFEVYGLRNETDREPIKLGAYKYDYNGRPLQTFAAHMHGLIFEIVELRILSNHGNPNFTCLYRFRVHGKLAPQHEPPT